MNLGLIQTLFNKKQSQSLYDAEIEYLESTGVEWINTEITDLHYLTVDCTGSFPNVTYSEFQGHSPTIFGVRGSGYNLDFLFGGLSQSQRYVRMNRNSSCAEFAGDVQATDIFRAVVTPSKLELYRNGTLAGTTTAANMLPSQSSLPIYLFYLNGVTWGDFKVRVYSFVASVNGTMLRDFIPVRKGTTGYMYDKVSGQLFGNSGSGNFILGPDIK